MTIDEKRQYLFEVCKGRKCGECPAQSACHRNKKPISMMTWDELDEMINEVQKCEPTDKEVEQELAECENQKSEKADLVELANDYCNMIPVEYCDTEKIAPCAMCKNNECDFEHWTEEDLQKFIDDCRKLIVSGLFSQESEDYDTVEKPKHYASTSIECIDAMTETQGVEAVKSFCICNAFKYLWRHNNKNGDEDIRKASWYLNKAVELMGDKHEN